MHRLLFTLIALLSLTLIAAPAQTAYACSGGPPPLSINYLMQHSLIVKATVVETDDASINAVLRVESYLNAGSGDEYLLYQRNDPVLSRVYGEHQYGTGCTYNGGGMIAAGTSAYFALERHADGSYHDVDSMLKYFPLIQLPIREPQSVYVLNDPDAEERDWGSVTRVDITSERRFIEVLREYGEVSIVPPDEERQFRPLIAPLLITTETGAQYQLPVDRRDPFLVETPVAVATHPANAYPDLLEFPPYCAEVGCRLSTPDYSLYAEQTGAEAITIGVPYGECGGLQVLAGQAFAFSPTSESMLVWNGDHLDVYLIQSRASGGDRMIDGFNGICGMGNAPQLWRIFSLSLEGTRVGEAEWSADGSILAYADDQGIWWLDIWRAAEPHLRVPRNWEQFPVPVFVSTTGRYLGFKTDRDSTDWLMMDMESGELFENALVSRNERRIALLAPTQPIEPRDRFECAPPLASTCPLVFDAFPHEFGWINADSYYVLYGVSQGGAQSASYGLLEGVTYLPDLSYHGLPFGGTIADLAYEPHQSSFAVVTGESELRFAGLQYGRVDLSGTLDGAITQIEWLPPLFYFVE